MSLGIEAGSKAVLITTDLDDEEAGDVCIVDPDYPERLDGLPEGVYTFEGDSFLFEVGNYHTYNAWRTQLSRLALNVELQAIWDNPEAFAGQSFIELLDFADNEGAIGPKTSRKLAEDFEIHAEHLKGLIGTAEAEPALPADRFLELYDNFQAAFKLASYEGFVVFE